MFPSRLPGWLRSRVAGLLSSAVLGLAFVCAPARAQNLLQNGSFESSSFTSAAATTDGYGYVANSASGGYSDHTAVVPSWTYTPNPANPTDSTFVLNKTGGSLLRTAGGAEDGSYYVSFGTGSYNPGGTITQSFTATAGQPYGLTLWVGRVGDGAPLAASVVIKDTTTNSTIASQAISLSGVGSGQWIKVTVPFTATSSNLSIAFTDATPAGSAGSADLLLDNVSITPLSLQTLTIYGTDAAPGTIDPNTDCSKDNDVTWLPAYALTPMHPWQSSYPIAGTTRWISRSADGMSAPTTNDYNPEVLDFRIRFYAPTDITAASMNFILDPDNYGDIYLNGTKLNSQQIVGPSTTPYTVANANIKAGLNTIIVRLTDTGGWLGINYSVTVQGYASSAFQRLSAPPAVTTITSTTANGSYKAGTVIPVQLTFTRPVTVTGAPTLTLATGTSSVATYASGSGTSTLTFNYTVRAGDNSADLEYLSTTALALNGGSIISSAADAQAANLLLPTPGASGSLSANKALVIDTTAPTLSVPAAITATATSASGATVTYSASASDNLSTPTVSYSVASGSTFAVGQTNVSVTATDAAGNPTTKAFTVTVQPAVATITFTTPAYTYDGTAKPATATTSPAGLPVAFTYDGGSTSAPVSAGSHSVTAAVNQGWITGSAVGTVSIAKAVATVTLSNTVQSFDGTPKSVSVATTPAGVPVTVTYGGNATAPTAVGSYGVVATVSSPNYTGSANATLQIKDVTPPVLSLPANIAVNATSAAGATVTFTATATDNVDGTVPVTLSAQSGSLFAPGTTIVTATAVDAAGNKATGSFSVTVRYVTLTEDKTAITIPQGGTATNSGLFSEASGEAVTLTASSGTLTQTGAGQWTFQQMLAPGGNPIELVLDTQENLYVVSQTAVVKYDANGTLVTQWAVAGTPTGIAIDTAHGWLYVVSRDGAIVRKFDLNGNLLTSWGTPGGGNGQFNTPHCVAVDANGTVYVTDSFNYRVQVFDSNGVYQRQWGTGGSGDGQFNFPQGIRITPNGTVYIADRNNNRVQYFRTDGTFLGKWGSGGSGNGQFSSPASVGIDPSGNVYVGDINNNRVQKFTATGSYLDQVGPGSGDGTLSMPHGTAFAPSGRSVYIASWNNGHVVKYLTPGAWSWTYTPAANAVGTSTVTVNAVSAGGATATTSFSLTINDVTPPVITAPADVTIDATSASGAVATFTATALDNVSGNVAVTASPASGSTFALGTTKVTFTATDAAQNVATASFNVTVKPAVATITFTTPAYTYDGTGKPATVTTSPAGLPVSFVYDSASASAPVAAGTHAVTATVNQPWISGTASGSVAIAKATPVIAVTPYTTTYSATAHSATGTATGVNGETLAGLDLSGTVHTNAGSYTDAWSFVDATGNYQAAAGSVADAIAPAVPSIGVTGYQVTYDGAAHAAIGSVVGVDGAPLSGLNLTASVHTSAGTYTDSWTFTAPNGNYTNASGQVSSAIAKATPQVTVTPYAVTYDAAGHTATGVVKGVQGEALSGLDLSGTTHTNAGTFQDKWAFTDVTGNYVNAGGSIADTITAAKATVAVNGYTGVYDGKAHGASGTATGVNQGDLVAMLNLGTSFTNVPGGTANWTFHDPAGNYQDASGSVAISITQATPTIAVKPYAVSYDGNAHSATGSATGVAGETLAGLDLSASTHTAAGSYNDTWMFKDVTGNYVNQASTVSDTIAKAAPTVVVNPYNVTYDTKSHTATGNVTGVKGEALSGLDLSGTTHTGAGSYTDTWTFTDSTGNYANATASVNDKIAKAIATITLSPLAQWYDGTARTVTATTVPAGLTVTITYNGGSVAPILPGAYAVMGTVVDPNYAGTYADTLAVAITGIVRHGIALEGDIDGSLQIINPENDTLNGQAMISGDLLVAGSPVVKVNGKPTYGGTVDFTGSATPSNYTVTLNGTAVLRHVAREVDPLTLPTISAPPLPTGTRNVTLDAKNTNAGDFSTINNLTVNAAQSTAVAIPAGTYGTLTASGTGSIVLGVSGATTPAVYNLQALKLSGNASIAIAGPVIINLANGVTLSGNVGASAHPEWLSLRIASGGLTLNGQVKLYGAVIAPAGTVTITGQAVLTGAVTADTLTIVGGGLLVQPE